MGLLSALFGDKTHYATSAAYEQMRADTLKLTGAALKMNPDLDGPIAAILMESGKRETISALRVTGKLDCELHFSNGRSSSGANASHVRSVAEDLLRGARASRKLLSPTTKCRQPAPGEVRLYVVLIDGKILAGGGAEKALGNQNHPLANIFFDAHRVVTAIQQHAKKG